MLDITKKAKDKKDKKVDRSRRFTWSEDDIVILSEGKSKKKETEEEDGSTGK